MHRILALTAQKNRRVSYLIATGSEDTIILIFSQANEHKYTIVYNPCQVSFNSIFVSTMYVKVNKKTQYAI
jgi:hypothetical protein